MRTYPLFLVHLDRARCVVVGGGDVAARKASALREADAQVLVIAPDVCKRLQRMVTTGEISLIGRSFQSGDLEGAFLAIAATDDPSVNDRVWQEARAHGLLINVVDDPERCNFIAPSVVRCGPMTLAISTSGRCPAFSRHVRQELEREFGAAYGDYVELLGDLRGEAVADLSLAERRAFWTDIFRSDVLALLASGAEDDAHRLARAILEEHVSQGA